jgi:DNA-binding NarL/FixJ family response regulator
MKSLIKVGILENHKTSLALYKNYLSSRIDIDVVFTYKSVKEIELNQDTIVCPDLILADIDMEGPSGMEGLTSLVKIFPEAKIIMLTGSEEGEDVITALKLGAVGYVVKSADTHLVYQAIKTTMQKGSFISPKAAWNVVQELQKKPKDVLEGILSKREREVVDYLKNGLSYKEIAAQMFISVHAVNQHLKKIYRKLQVKSKGELMAKYYQQQLGGRFSEIEA